MSSIETEFGTLSVNTANLLPVSNDGPCRIVDGDTIMIGGRRWRLDGFDAPAIRGRSGGQPHCDVEHQIGVEAAEYLEQLLKQGATQSSLHIDIINKTDKYARQLVCISVDGRSIADHMLEAGYAFPYNGKGSKQPWCECEDRLQLYQAEQLVAVNKEQAARARRREARSAQRQIEIAKFNAASQPESE